MILSFGIVRERGAGHVEPFEFPGALSIAVTNAIARTLLWMPSTRIRAEGWRPERRSATLYAPKR